MDDTPTTIEEAYSSPDADLWKEAVRSEMDSIRENFLSDTRNNDAFLFDTKIKILSYMSST